MLFYSLLDEKQRRLYAGLEAMKFGHGGDQQIADLLGIDPGTVARGRRDLMSQDVEIERVRKRGGGRRSVQKNPGRDRNDRSDHDPRNRAWKHFLQQQLCDRYGVTVTVCHYPTSASKWNPIEHRLFSEISKNWAGKPLDSFETILNYAQSTTTSTGLTVKAYFVAADYPKGVKITDNQMRRLRFQPHSTQPMRNYTLLPR